jgi:hypothetical protein
MDRARDVVVLGCALPDEVHPPEECRESFDEAVTFDSLGFGVSSGSLHVGRVVADLGDLVQTEHVRGDFAVAGASGGAIVVGDSVIGIMAKSVGGSQPRTNYFIPIRHALPLLPEAEPKDLSSNGSPLFSEFPASWTRFSVGPLGAFGVMLALALAALWLSRHAGAHCMRAVAEGDATGVTYFGYVAELNHGPFQLIGAPLFVALSLRFVQSWNSFLVQTTGRGTLYLKTRNVSERPRRALEQISSWNRRLFRWGFLPVALFVASVILVGEALGRDRFVLGWVQADHVAEQAGVRKPLASYPRSAELRRVPAFRAACSSFEQCTVLVEGGVPPERALSFRLFLAVALVAQVLFLIVVVWVIWKLLFVLMVLWSALTSRSSPVGATRPSALDRSWSNTVGRALFGSSRSWLRVKLDFDDRRNRFGLAALDPAYTAGMWLLLLGALGTTFGFLSNFAKATRFRGSTSTDLLGQVILPTLFLLSMVALPGIPATVVLRLAARLRERLLETLQRQRGRLSPGQAVAQEIEDRIERAERQTAWPQHNRLFYAQMGLLAVLTIAGGIYPLLNAYGAGPTWVLPWLSRIDQGLCDY